MYIVAIAWLYVVLMMSITERSLIAGIMTFLFYGLLPCGLLVWLVGTPLRKRRKAMRAEPGTETETGGSVAEQHMHAPDRHNTDTHQ
jgi:hypothetical protein